MRTFLIGLFLGLAVTTLGGQVWVHAPTAGKLVKVGCDALGHIVVLPETLNAGLAVIISDPAPAPAPTPAPAPPPTPPPMPPPTTWTLAVDDGFTGARGDLLTAHTPVTGSGWDASTSFVLAFSGMLGSAVAPDVARNLTILPADQAVAVTLAEVNNPIAPAVRLDATRQNGYAVIWRANIFADLQLVKLVSGAMTLIASVDQVPGVAGDVVRVDVKGSAFTVKINDTVKLTATDSTFATGSAGYLSVMGMTNQITHFSAWAAQ